MKVNEKLIKHLREDSRKSLSEVSRQIGIPVTTLHDALKRYEHTGVIRKHTSIIDFHKLGYHTRAHIALSADKDSRDDLRDFLLSHENLNSMMKINTGYDYLVDMVFKDKAALKLFVEELNEKFKISIMHTFIHISPLREEVFFNDKKAESQNGPIDST